MSNQPTKQSLADRLTGWMGRCYRDGECLRWPKPIRYPKITVDGRPQAVHRLVCEMFNGPIPDGYEVDHLCRVTDCIEPTHLEAVPPAINNRRAHGKLTPEQVEEVRLKAQSGQSYESLGREYGVSGLIVSRIARRLSFFYEGTESIPATEGRIRVRTGAASKPCVGCGVEKPLEDYWRDKNRSDGRVGRCKSCCAKVWWDKKRGVA